MNKTTNRATNATGKVKISDKGCQLLALIALVVVFVIASIGTIDFHPSNSNPSSKNMVSYTIARENANHISQER